MSANSPRRCLYNEQNIYVPRLYHGKGMRMSRLSKSPRLRVGLVMGKRTGELFTDAKVLEHDIQHIFDINQAADSANSLRSIAKFFCTEN